MGLSTEQIDSLERIQSLKVSGAISSIEFENLKAKILEPVANAIQGRLDTSATTQLPLPGSLSSTDQNSSGLGTEIVINRHIADCMRRIYEVMCALDGPVALTTGNGELVFETTGGYWKFNGNKAVINIEEIEGDGLSPWTVVQIEIQVSSLSGLGASKLLGALYPQITERLAPGFVVVHELRSSLTLDGLDFSGVDLRQAWLSGASLIGTKFCAAHLSGAGLRKANLERADLSNANLTMADFDSANLRFASLSWANCKGSSLFGCDLRDADLSNADLRSMTLAEADLSGANLIGVNMNSSTLSIDEKQNFDREYSAISAPYTSGPMPETILESANFTNILWDETTMWPEGFTPPPSR